MLFQPPGPKRESWATRHRPLLAGLLMLLMAFALALFAVLPKVHHVSDERAIENATGHLSVPLTDLLVLGAEYGGLYGNLTLMASAASSAVVHLSSVEGTDVERELVLSPNVATSVEVEGLIPIEIDFYVGSWVTVSYSYDIMYMEYRSPFYGIVAAVFSFVGAGVSFKGLYASVTEQGARRRTGHQSLSKRGPVTDFRQ